MIQFSQIRKIYPKQVGSQAHIALQDLSFSLEKEKTLGLVGANGAGKSTSICLLMDFIRPDQGSIRIFGKPPHAPDVRLKIGYLPEKTEEIKIYPDQFQQTILNLLLNRR